VVEREAVGSALRVTNSRRRAGGSQERL